VYVDNGLISVKEDIFSLGVIIIELMSGDRDYPTTEESHEQFIDYVSRNRPSNISHTEEFSMIAFLNIMTRSLG
jgi:serine/threonine protein kinase